MFISGLSCAAKRAWACAGNKRSAWRKRWQQLSHSMADVAILFFGLDTTPIPDLAEAHPGAKKGQSSCADGNRAHGAMRSQIGAIHRIARVFLPLTWAIEDNRPYVIGILAIGFFCVTTCTTISSHTFSKPTSDWQTKTGQLMYRTAKTTLIGDAVVRFSKVGDFELTVSKGPGIALLSLRQDASFAEVKGAFAARQGWSGPVAQAPPQLRGWLALRDQFIHKPNQKTLQSVAGDETFLFRF